MSDRFDAIVIGASAAGLAAAVHLARAGLRTVVLEAAAMTPAQLPHPVLAGLDPALVQELRLTGIGAWQAAPGLRTLITQPKGPALGLGGARGGGWMRPRDVEALHRMRCELQAVGRLLFPSSDPDTRHNALSRRSARYRGLVEQLAATSALDWLSARLDSAALVSALALDTALVGAAPSEPGSALALAWAAPHGAMGGPGDMALATPRLYSALAQTARLAGTEIRTGARVRSLLINPFAKPGGAVTGAILSNGTAVEARVVLSATSHSQTFGELLSTPYRGLARDMAPPGPRVLMATLRLPPRAAALALSQYRVIAAREPREMARGYVKAQADQMPSALCTELVLAPVANGQLQPITRAWPLPENAQPAAVSRHILQDLGGPIGEGAVLAGTIELATQLCASASRLLAPARERIATPLPGFFFCGDEAEPVNQFSGRAPRLAAEMALAYCQDSR